LERIAYYIILGVVSGVFSGLIGIGGGIIIIPALVIFFEFTQQQAQGTTLALMVPPIGLLAAYAYYKHGFVDMKAASLICLGFFIGGFFGAKFAVSIPKEILQKIFGIFLVTIGLYFVVKK